MAIGSIGVALSAGIGLLAPIVVRYGIDGIDKASPETVTPILLRYALFILGIAVAKGIFLYYQRMIMVGMSRDIEYDLRNEFYDHLQNLPQQFYQEYRTGDLMARATNDLNAVRMLAGPAIMYGEGTLFNTVIALPLMFSINWKLTLLALCSLPFVSYATSFFAKRIHQRFESIQEYFSTITAQAQENFSGVRVVRAYAQENREIETFEKMNREFVGRNMKLIRLTGVFHPMLQALVGLGFVAVLWYGGRLTLAGEMTVGQYVQFNLYLVMLIWPMIALGWVVNLFQRGMASMNRINAVLEIKPAITNTRAQKEIKEIYGEIEFRNLTYKYPGTERAVLKDINLKIKHGQTVAIVGHTGSGKSTLVNLVPRLIDAESGQVLIDGHPIGSVPLDVLRSNIGYVPQETFLFSETVGGNIAFGTPNATAEDVKNAAESAGLLEDIEGFPKRFDTIVGERGITLSGGQKQRTAIARSVIRHPKILLLDDSLSSVDTYTEEKILSHLRGIMSGRTSIIVSHRVSTVKDADLIVVLQDGEIVERGTHDELLLHDGLYAQLHEEQLLEEELAAS